MTRGLLFWILMILWVIFSIWWFWPAAGGSYVVLGFPVLIFILLALLGWQVFGAPIKG